MSRSRTSVRTELADYGVSSSPSGGSDSPGVAAEHVAVSGDAASMPVDCLQLGRPIYDGWAHVVVVTYPREYSENKVVPRTADLAAPVIKTDQ